MIIIETVRAILPGLILTFVAGAIGRFCLGRVMNGSDENVSLLSLQVGLGFVILITFFNLLLVFKILSLINGYVLIILLSAFLCKQLYFFSKALFKSGLRLYRWVRIKSIRLIPIFIVFLTFIFGFVGLLAPSTGYDSTVYHLTLPKIYAGEGGFVPRPDIIQSRLPQNLVSIRTFCYQWGGEGAIEFLNMIACALLLWLLIDLVVLVNGNNRWRSWAIIIFCSSLQFIFYLYDADVEGWLAFFTLCLFTCVYLINSQSGSTFLLACGAFSGCLVGIKPTTLPVGILLVMFGFLNLFSLKRRIPWKAGIGAVSLAILIGGFWYIIIFEIYGHLYGTGLLGLGIPLFSMDRFQFGTFWASFRSVVIYNSPFLIYIFLIPQNLKSRVGRKIFFIFICISPLIFITNPWGSAYVRYTYYIFPLIVLGIVIAFAQLDSINSKACKGIRFVFIGLLAFFLLVTQFANIYRNYRKFAVAFDLQEEDRYLAERVNTYKTIQLANRIVPPNGKLFMVGERSYWLDIPYVLGIERNPNITYDEMTPDKFFKLLNSQRITHLLFSDEKADYTSEFLKFWNNYPLLKKDSKLELLHHDFWQDTNGCRNSYLFKVNFFNHTDLGKRERANG